MLTRTEPVHVTPEPLRIRQELDRRPAPPRASGPDPVSWAARAFFTQPRSDSGLTPSSYATSVTVRPDGHTSSTASQRSLRIYAHSMPSSRSASMSRSGISDQRPMG
ncbi:hypothetical protein SHIRM173S_06036 [Streptomyces hirsutus]